MRARCGALQELLTSCGARAEIERSIASLTERAIVAMGSAPLTPEARDALVIMARYVAERER